MKAFLIFFLALPVFSKAQTPETRCKELNLQFPELTSPVANYVHAVRSGNLLFLGARALRLWMALT